MEKYYTIYDDKTDEVIAFGTADQCIKKMNMKNRNSFFTMVSKVKSGRVKKYKIIEENLEEE